MSSRAMPHPYMTNPYLSSAAGTPDSSVTRQSTSKGVWVASGFVIGAAGPVAIGTNLFYSQIAYSSSLPPGTAGCGNGMLAAILMILFVAPVGGLIGSGFAWTLWGAKSRFDTRSALVKAISATWNDLSPDK